MSQPSPSNPDFYRQTLATHGPTAKGVGWGSDWGQQKRLDVLLNYIGPGSILDVGCGYGALCDRLPGRQKDYLGVDALPEMVREARRKHPGWSFWCADALDSGPMMVADYVLASGLFTFSDREHMQAVIARLWDLTRKVLAFNCIAKADSGEYAPDPAEVMEFCRMLAAKVELRQDYHDWDFTVIMRRC